MKNLYLKQIIIKFILLINLNAGFLLFQNMMKMLDIFKIYMFYDFFIILIKKTQPQRDSNPQPYDPKSHALSIAPWGCLSFIHKLSIFNSINYFYI